MTKNSTKSNTNPINTTITRFRLENISKSYTSGHKKHTGGTVLKDISFEIPEKQVTALVGPSGSGKSTLARLIMQIESPDSGSIFYKNQPINSIPIKEFRKKNQLMYQSPLLAVNPTFTVSKIIEEPLKINFPHTPKKETRQKILHWLNIMKLPTAYLNKKPQELSGGELQRVVLTRTLIMEPEFIILDEPFSSLDESTANHLITYLEHLFESLNITVLLISHTPEHVNTLVSSILRL